MAKSQSGRGERVPRAVRGARLDTRDAGALRRAFVETLVAEADRDGGGETMHLTAGGVTAIDRFRNGRSIFTPPRELQAAITNDLRATGQLDDFEVDALVLAGVMKKVHLRHPRYQKEAACGQPYPTVLTDDRDLVTCGRCGRAGRASASVVGSHSSGGASSSTLGQQLLDPPVELLWRERRGLQLGGPATGVEVPEFPGLPGQGFEPALVLEGHRAVISGSTPR